MIRLSTLISENTSHGIKMMSPSEFESKGGYTIGIGQGIKMYTLRSEVWDTIGVYEGPYGAKTSKKIRRSYHHRNLGKDWRQVIEKLPKVLNGDSIFIPGFAKGKLDPNSPPDHTVPKHFMFGKYKGMTIEDVAEENLNYLLWVGSEFKVNPKKRKLYNFIQKIREFLGDDLDKYLAAKKKKVEDAEKKRKQQEINAKAMLGNILDVLRYAAKSYHRYLGHDVDAPEYEAKFDRDFFSDFTSSIYHDMKSGKMPRGRGIDITRDIYAKNHTMQGKRHRRNSKIYNKGLENFDAVMRSFDPSYEV